jgi:thioredoxin
MNTLIATCSSCGTKNRIPADKQHRRPLCGSCKAPLDVEAAPVELGDQDFHDFIKQAPLPVMVDFFSPTCAPCQMMLPIISALAKEQSNRFIIAKVDTGKSQQIAFFFNIRSVPSFLFFKNGSLIDRMTGAVSKNILEQKLKSL